MSDLARADAPRRPARRRRSPQFLAQVEALDARQLLAAGVSGQVFGLMGVAGQSVASTNGNPSGADVLVLRLSADGDLSAAGVVASVDYGDGSPSQAASVTPIPKITGTPGDDLLVLAPDHTYAGPGDYAITVAVVEPGDVAPTLFTTRAIVRAPDLPLTGDAVDAAKSLLGPIGGPFLATATRTPTFAGTTAPGATVVVTVTGLVLGASPASTEVVTAVADAAGRWRVTSASLADGSYGVSVTATGSFGSSATLGLAGYSNSSANAFLRVDTVGPKISDFRITDARKGTFSITYSKLYGTLGVSNPDAYAIRRTSPALPKGQAIAATDLVDKTARNLGSNGSIGFLSIDHFDPTEVTGRIRVDKKASLPNGTYTLTVRSPFVTSAAGVPLDGEFAGTLPTGDGAAGGDFRVKFTVRNGRASKILPVAPAKPAKHHA